MFETLESRRLMSAALFDDAPPATELPATAVEAEPAARKSTAPRVQSQISFGHANGVIQAKGVKKF
jgi:hypothetical protein